MRRIDSHCHLWELSRGDYTWLDINDPSLAAIARDFFISDLAPLISEHGIEELVVVQAAATEAETDYLLSLANKHNEIVGVVGWVDVESDTASASLNRFAEHAYFKGIRPMLQDIEDTQWLLHAPRSSIWTQLAELDLRLDALVQPRHLPMLHQFCHMHLDLPVVIDHIAKPQEAFGGDEEAFKAWAENMMAFGKNTGAYCKVSGLLTELPESKRLSPLATIKPAFDVLLESFGPTRLMWGSDWPVLTLASSYHEWNKVLLQLVHELSSDEQALILGGSAARFYALEATADWV